MTRFEFIQIAFNAAKNGANIDRKISSNTRIEVYNNSINVLLHNTYVFCYDVDINRVIIRTGGWNTATTRKVINECFAACNLNYKLTTKSGDLFLNGAKITFNAYRGFNVVSNKAA